MLPHPADFWQFAAELYARPGVQTVCLEAQDLYGADVNLILLYLWCDMAGITLPEPTHDALETLSALWQREKLAPHRARRRDAKGSEYYQQLLADELILEKAEQEALLEKAKEAPLPETASQPANCAGYLAQLGAPKSFVTVLQTAIRRA